MQMKTVLAWLLIGFTPLLSPALGAELPKKKLLLVDHGPDGHPKATHEFRAGARIMRALVEQFPEIEVTTARGDGEASEVPGLVREADAVLLFVPEGAKWVTRDPRRMEALSQHIQRGGGFAALHWAIGTRDAKYIEPFRSWLGGCHGGRDRKYKFLETDIRIASDHPITAGIEPFRIRDEFYYQLKFAKPAEDEGRLVPLLEAAIDGEHYPVAWAYERPDGGRSFGYSGYHYHENWQRDEYRRLATQGILWILKLDPPADGIELDMPSEIYKLPE